MIKIDALIVVEGKTDIDFLSSFIDASFYKVNGSAINSKDLDFIRKAKEKTNVIILTDPDYPGLKIRNTINENIDGLFNAYVRKEVSIKHHKVGVAESTKEEIISSLKNIVLYDHKNELGTLKESDLYELGFIGRNNSKELRKEAMEYFHIGYGNAKSFLKKLNLLNINKKELEEFINVTNK